MIIKLNTIADFKAFFQGKLTDNPGCMDTVKDCIQVATKFENMTEAGKRHTAACHSSATVAQVMAAATVGHGQPSNPDVYRLGQQTSGASPYLPGYTQFSQTFAQGQTAP